MSGRHVASLEKYYFNNTIISIQYIYIYSNKRTSSLVPKRGRFQGNIYTKTTLEVGRAELRATHCACAGFVEYPTRVFQGREAGPRACATEHTAAIIAVCRFIGAGCESSFLLCSHFSTISRKGVLCCFGQAIASAARQLKRQ